MWMYLAGLVWVGLIVGIIWSYRKKTAQREAARAQQLAQLLVEVKRNPPVPTAAATVAGSGPAAAPLFTRKPKLLAPTHSLLYYVLRAGLPDHAIFAHQSLSNFIDASHGPAREQQQKRLAAQHADFIVCNKQLEVVAVVMIETATVDSQLLESALRSAGIRLLQIDAATPPKHTQVRALVYGADEPSAG